MINNFAFSPCPSTLFLQQKILAFTQEQCEGTAVRADPKFKLRSYCNLLLFLRQLEDASAADSDTLQPYNQRSVKKLDDK